MGNPSWRTAVVDLFANRNGIAETAAERLDGSDGHHGATLPKQPAGWSALQEKLADAVKSFKVEAPAQEHERLAPVESKTAKRITIRGVIWHAIVYWRPYWLLAIPVVVSLYIQEGFDTFFDLQLQNIIENVLIAKQAEVLIVILIQLGIGYALATAASVVGNYMTARISSHIMNDLRLKLFKHMQRLSMGYYANARSGDIISRFTNDLAEIEKGLTTRFTDGNLALVGISINVPALLFLQWKLGLIVLLALPLITVGTRLFAPRASASYAKLKQEQASFTSGVQENIKAQGVIRLFGLQRLHLVRVRRQLRALFQRTLLANFLSMLVGTTSSLGVRLVQLLIIGLGAYFAFHGWISIGGLVAFTAVLADVSTDTYSISKKVVPSLIAAGSGVQRIEEFLDIPAEIADDPEARPLAPFTREIQFKHVHFAYANREQTLRDINLAIRAGQFVAFVGPTGAGKSSIINLLTRFYDATSGAVLIDGQDIRKVTQQSLHAQMAAVFQETFLFNTSLRENIRLGKQDATDDEIVAAARAAEIHDAILRLPQGYDTKAGEMGGLLSGGQRQRIAIARAIIRDPRILLLDEPTSDLDPVTEAAINETLLRLAQRRTVIAVTHHLAMIQQADQIFVVQDGAIVERGRHELLMRRQGLYYRLWNIQEEY